MAMMQTTGKNRAEYFRRYREREIHFDRQYRETKAVAESMGAVYEMPDWLRRRLVFLILNELWNETPGVEVEKLRRQLKERQP